MGKLVPEIGYMPEYGALYGEGGGRGVQAGGGMHDPFWFWFVQYTKWTERWTRFCAAWNVPE